MIISQQPPPEHDQGCVVCQVLPLQSKTSLVLKTVMSIFLKSKTVLKGVLAEEEVPRPCCNIPLGLIEVLLGEDVPHTCSCCCQASSTTYHVSVTKSKDELH